MNTEMSVNEAIKRIQDHMRVHKLNEPRAHLINTAHEMAISALEKQTGVEPNYDGNLYACPNCGTIELHNSRNKFCPDCGQRLDWTNAGNEER